MTDGNCNTEQQAEVTIDAARQDEAKTMTADFTEIIVSNDDIDIY